MTGHRQGLSPKEQNRLELPKDRILSVSRIVDAGINEQLAET
jgi:hypothetical protein